MGLTGTLRRVALETCPHCNKEYGKHSKKGFMKCLYTANYNLYNVVIELNQLKSKQPLEIPEKIVVDDVGNVEMTGSVEITDNCGGDIRKLNTITEKDDEE